MFAITLTSLLAVIGLLYSFGIILAQRRALQTAADAASLRGTWQVLAELASDNRADANVLAAIVNYAASNGVSNPTNVSAVYVDANNTQLGNVGVGGQFASSVRGVRVTVQNQVQTILPGFVKISQVLVQDSASATARPTTAPASANLVLPIAVLVTKAQIGYAAHSLYDLFANPTSGGQPPTLNLATSGATSFGSLATNVQYWSDGQHLGSWMLSQPGNVNLAGGTYYDSIAIGLKDNVRGQALPPDSNNAPYALVTVPLYDTSTSTTVHIVGFAQLKILNSDIGAASTKGTFVPYATAAWGTPVVPTLDIGAALVGIVS